MLWNCEARTLRGEIDPADLNALGPCRANRASASDAASPSGPLPSRCRTVLAACQAGSRARSLSVAVIDDQTYSVIRIAPGGDERILS